MAYFGFSHMNNEIQAIESAEYFYRVVDNYFSLLIAHGNGDMIAKLRSYFDSISLIYRQGLRNTGSRPDWSNGDYRRTYVYRFFAMHCHLVYRSLQLSLADFKFQESWKYKSSFHVCCIGGGPGSDVVGLTKFLRDNKLVPVHRLKCAIIDLYCEWGVNWDTIRQSNPNEFPLISYNWCDLARTDCHLTSYGLQIIRTVDIITFVKFFSTVAAFMRKNDAQRKTTSRNLQRNETRRSGTVHRQSLLQPTQRVSVHGACWRSHRSTV